MTGELYVQIATLEIDPSRIEEYRAAVAEQIKAAIENEPGVLTLSAVADRSNPARVTVFEIYRNRGAYEAHLKAAHFLVYKAKVESIVKSLTLTPMVPVALGPQP
jgi:quinol monooxygenase YgiN